MANIIEVSGLVKRYGSVTAVDGISFTVEEGSLFAFLGPNGAGKSTTINILCTILGKDEGKVLINGHEVGHADDAVRHSIGVVFQNSVLDDLLTVRENIVVRAGFYGLQGSELKKRMNNIIEVVGLGDFIDRRYGKLSGGQRRRADIARALINTPRILFLDEPTTGLDPQTRLKVWTTIQDMQKRDKMTVFLTTHYMEEAATADDVAIIDHGRIAAQGSPAVLKDQYSTDSLVVVPKDEELAQMLQRDNVKFKAQSDTLVLPVQDSLSALNILKRIEPHVASFEVLKGNMDTVFMNVTGRQIRGEGEGE